MSALPETGPETGPETETIQPRIDSPWNDPPAAQGASGGWLPTRRQLADALRLRVERAAGPEPEGAPFVRGVHSSMRQGFGLIVLAGLGAGLLHFALLWSRLASLGTTLPLLRAQSWLERLALRLPNGSAWAQAGEQIGGLAPRAPLWAAAGLNAFGAWLHLPLRLLTLWIVYGLLVLATAKLLGAGTTLPRFYAVTAYAALPLLIGILAPLPWVGPLFAVAAAALALVAYALAVRAATNLEIGRTILCMLLPAALLAALYGIFTMLIGGLLFL